MIGLALIAAVLPPTLADLPSADTRSPFICWVTDVVTSENGVRIYFNRKGGPGFVSTPNGGFRPDAAPADPARPEEAGVEARLGDKLFPQNSPEDGCSLEIVRRNGRIGVRAMAYFHPVGLPAQKKTEFIPAHD
ncbi:hypothetical protein [Sphingomonas sp. NIBR02145]|uniref:hypothetical protein n=1 Tax=Sphingomonas sp. NIBR02145 TaxID=3014784 RepID=UPI0022B3DF3A|nr:hypothetical protein [Sphingomonas sp. NIBR02145]WHU02282.1 hypothetical protein O3305_19170 [Sphingomonas sp. NIBR02145]